MSHNASTLKLRLLQRTPSDSGASFWNGGAGPAADEQGNVFMVSANGDFDGNEDGLAEYDESVLRLTPRSWRLRTSSRRSTRRCWTRTIWTWILRRAGAARRGGQCGTSASRVYFRKEGRMYCWTVRHWAERKRVSDASALSSVAVSGSHATFGSAGLFQWLNLHCARPMRRCLRFRWRAQIWQRRLRPRAANENSISRYDAEHFRQWFRGRNGVGHHGR